MTLDGHSLSNDGLLSQVTPSQLLLPPPPSIALCVRVCWLSVSVTHTPRGRGQNGRCHSNTKIRNIFGAMPVQKTKDYKLVFGLEANAEKLYDVRACPSCTILMLRLLRLRPLQLLPLCKM